LVLGEFLGLNVEHDSYAMVSSSIKKCIGTTAAPPCVHAVPPHPLECPVNQLLLVNIIQLKHDRADLATTLRLIQNHVREIDAQIVVQPVVDKLPWRIPLLSGLI
jgi:hypothetical protein